MEATSDGGFIIAGSTRSFGAGGSDFYLIRTDAGGDTLWHRTYGGTGTDYARGVRQTPDGGFIVVGSSDVSGAGDYDAYVVKTDVAGDTVWTRHYGTANGNDRGSDIRQTPDGGYFIAGYTNSFGHGGNDGWLIKTDPNGNVLWESAYGWLGDEYFEKMGLNSDGGCILVGSTTSSTPPGWDAYMVRTKADGDTLWVSTFGGTGQDYGYCGVQTFDGGFMVVGANETATKGYEIYIRKLYPNGGLEWRRFYGGTDNEEAYSVRQVGSDSGYVVVGWTDSYGAGDWDVYLLRTDSAGDTLWTTTYGDSLRDWGWEIELLQHDEYIISGTTRSYGAGSDDVYLLRTEGDPAGTGKTHIRTERILGVRAWPNPTVSGVTLEYVLPAHGDVEISVYDCRGRQVRRFGRHRSAAGTHTLTWDGRDARGRSVGPGIYFYTVKAGQLSATTKSVVLR
jgi:hypothetical protein